MFTPPKAAPAIVGVLALAFFAGTTQAARDPALRTAKDGWSTEPNCQRMHMDRTNTICYVVTRGQWVQGQDRPETLIQYLCSTTGQEYLAIVVGTNESVDRSDMQIPVQWDRNYNPDFIGTWFQLMQGGSKRLYYYFLEEPAPFIEGLREHATLTVTLPYRHARPKARFKLANAIPSIKKAMEGCHKKTKARRSGPSGEYLQ